MIITHTKRHIVGNNLDFIIGFSLHLFLVLSFLVAFVLAASNAQAQMAATINACDDRNYIDELSAEKLNAALAEAALIPNGTGLFWKIEKEGTKPSHLYGTMHITDPRVLNLSTAVKTTLDNADIVAIETLDLLDPKKAQAAVLLNPGLTMFTDGSTLTSNMSEEDAAFVEAELKSRGIAINLVAQFKPWMIMSLVAASDCETDRKTKGAQILDFQIIERAKSAGKSIKGLESITEQLSAMASLPIDFQIRGLLETLRLGDLNNDVMETMISLYAEEKIGLITPAIKAIAVELGQDDIDDQSFGDFEAKIITERNHLMAERSEPILTQGNAFIAVGALHLPGKQGLVELLRERGYTVTRAY